MLSRAPYGARGLKSKDSRSAQLGGWSRPVWGAWIEIALLQSLYAYMRRRAPYGARGLKFALQQLSQNSFMVAPRMGRVD